MHGGNHYVNYQDRGGPVMEDRGAGDGPYGSWNTEEGPVGDLEKEQTDDYLRQQGETAGHEAAGLNHTPVNLGDHSMQVVEHPDDKRVEYPKDPYDDRAYTAADRLRRIAATLRRQ